MIAIFLAAISLPLGGKLLGLESAFALTENRRPAPLPTIELKGWSLVSFPRRFERYWNDSFAFRRYLIRWHGLTKLGLGLSPSPKVVLGKDGYLFYAAEQSVDYFRAAKPFSPIELARWRDDLEGRRAWLAERGIRYLVVVAPNKETIYPEYMPEGIRPVRPETRLDQLLKELRENSNVAVLDLRGALRRAKLDGRVYHKTDTHWNDAGAFVAYREILAQLQKLVPGIDGNPAPISFQAQRTDGLDLARLTALEDRFPEEQINAILRKPRQAREAKGDPTESFTTTEVAVMECATCGEARAVMFHDSFNTNVAPFLAEHFGRIVYVSGSSLNRALIQHERPSVVIQEFVERYLMCPDLRGC